MASLPLCGTWYLKCQRQTRSFEESKGWWRITMMPKKWWGNYESDAQAQLSITLSILRVTWFDNDDENDDVASYKSPSPYQKEPASSFQLDTSIFHLSLSALLSHPPLLRLWGSPTSFYFSVLLFGPDHPAQSHFCGYFSTTIYSFWWVVKLKGSSTKKFSIA